MLHAYINRYAKLYNSFIVNKLYHETPCVALNTWYNVPGYNMFVLTSLYGTVLCNINCYDKARESLAMQYILMYDTCDKINTSLLFIIF